MVYHIRFSFTKDVGKNKRRNFSNQISLFFKQGIISRPKKKNNQFYVSDEETLSHIIVIAKRNFADLEISEIDRGSKKERRLTPQESDEVYKRLVGVLAVGFFKSPRSAQISFAKSLIKNGFSLEELDKYQNEVRRAMKWVSSQT